MNAPHDAGRAAGTRTPLGHAIWLPLLAGVGCAMAAAPVQAQNVKVTTTASASITETYTNNVNYTTQAQAEAGFVTTITETLGVNGSFGALKLNFSLSASEVFSPSQNQATFSLAPNINLATTYEVIDKFMWVDLNAVVVPTFLSPFGAQPSNLANASQNRYTQQNYGVSPYIQGRLGGSNVTYYVRDDNLWSIAGEYGGSSAGSQIPTTYSNNLQGSMTKPPNPWGWTLQYNRSYYDNGIKNAAEFATGSYTTQSIRLIVPYQVDQSLQVSGRLGYEGNRFPVQDSQGTIYGLGAQWNPSDRTEIGGFWEHRFFGDGYQAQVTHRLPNASLSASFSRGLNSYPQLALAIPAGATVNSFVNAAFATRIQDPGERQAAVDQFLARTGLPPTLLVPVNFYAASLTLQQQESLTLLLIGLRNSLSFTVFNVKSEAISGSGAELPPALQFGQNNTQTGIGVNYSYQLSGLTSLAASANYSKSVQNGTTGPIAGSRSNNTNLSVSLNTSLSAKTSAAYGVGYSHSQVPSDLFGGTTSAFNVFATLSHTFY